MTSLPAILMSLNVLERDFDATLEAIGSLFDKNLPQSLHDNCKGAFVKLHPFDACAVELKLLKYSGRQFKSKTIKN